MFSSFLALLLLVCLLKFVKIRNLLFDTSTATDKAGVADAVFFNADCDERMFSLKP